MKSTGFEINVDFSKKLTEDEQNIFWENFIDLLERKGLFFGGGDDENHLEGFIDVSESLDNIDQIESFLQEFLNKEGLIKKYNLILV